MGYKERFSFVPKYGEDVMGLLTVKPGARVVDLGCGGGALTAKLASRGYDVLGVDGSGEMIALAKAEHPDMTFIHAQAQEFALEQSADAIFSNAVFHWIDASEQDALIANVARNLAPGGELVCEFGGYGCAEAVHSTLEKCFEKRGMRYERAFYFPTVGQYAPVLERHGLIVEYATLFDRPTPQQSQDGLTDWINMFNKRPFEGVAEDVKRDILREANEILRPVLYVDGTWVIDYVRIRFRCRKKA